VRAHGEIAQDAFPFCARNVGVPGIHFDPIAAERRIGLESFPAAELNRAFADAERIVCVPCASANSLPSMMRAPNKR
jgi:hypothetical protein